MEISVLLFLCYLSILDVFGLCSVSQSMYRYINIIRVCSYVGNVLRATLKVCICLEHCSTDDVGISLLRLGIDAFNDVGSLSRTLKPIVAHSCNLSGLFCNRSEK